MFRIQKIKSVLFRIAPSSKEYQYKEAEGF